MKTFLRCSLYVCTMEYSFKAPQQVQEAATELKGKCRQYVIRNTEDIFLIPIDAEEYNGIMEFKEKYKLFFSGNLFYEHKFTKREMDNADYYLLTCASLVETLYDENDIYSHCCDKSRFREQQIGYYKMKKKSMRDRVIAFSYDYRFIISNEAKECIISYCLWEPKNYSVSLLFLYNICF